MVEAGVFPTAIQQPGNFFNNNKKTELRAESIIIEMFYGSDTVLCICHMVDLVNRKLKSKIQCVALLVYTHIYS